MPGGDPASLSAPMHTSGSTGKRLTSHTPARTGARTCRRADARAVTRFRSIMVEALPGCGTRPRTMCRHTIPFDICVNSRLSRRLAHSDITIWVACAKLGQKRKKNGEGPQRFRCAPGHQKVPQVPCLGRVRCVRFGSDRPDTPGWPPRRVTADFVPSWGGGFLTASCESWVLPRHANACWERSLKSWELASSHRTARCPCGFASRNPSTK